ncbi:hypothetical protein KCP74_21600 [Salmonella enterica subsp. enterica]|nr:hypothetical protein KCP74_21600 [Salmonella enterica subsp. enterica]
MKGIDRRCRLPINLLQLAAVDHPGCFSADVDCDSRCLQSGSAASKCAPCRTRWDK